MPRNEVDYEPINKKKKNVNMFLHTANFSLKLHITTIKKHQVLAYKKCRGMRVKMHHNEIPRRSFIQTLNMVLSTIYVWDPLFSPPTWKDKCKNIKETPSLISIHLHSIFKPVAQLGDLLLCHIKCKTIS